MSKFVAMLERKFGKYAIPRLPLYMLICYAIGYVMQLINPNIIYLLSLNPYAILHGQVWRIVSWVLIPPETSNLFFTLIMLYFYYSIANTLEKTWGTFYFNYYIFSGILFTLIGAFLMFGFVMISKGDELELWDAACSQYFMSAGGNLFTGGSEYFEVLSLYFSTYYINMSIFLAFAATYPDMQVMLMFIIPIKVKILAVIYAIILVIEGYHMGMMGLFVIGASLLNFVLFFLSTRKGGFKKQQQMVRQRQMRRRMQPMQPKHIARHKCAVCGRSSEDYPDLEFRFCSLCEGNYEYCNEHLYTHIHVKRQ